MSSTNVEIVREVFKAAQAGLASGDVGAVFELNALSDDAEWVPALEISGATTYRGRDGFAEFMRTWIEDFDEWSFELERIIDAGDDRVVVLAYQHAVGKGSGAPVDLHFAQVYELEHGRVVRIHNHVDPADALTSVGLETHES